MGSVLPESTVLNLPDVGRDALNFVNIMAGVLQGTGGVDGDGQYGATDLMRGSFFRPVGPNEPIIPRKLIQQVLDCFEYFEINEKLLYPCHAFRSTIARLSVLKIGFHSGSVAGGIRLENGFYETCKYFDIRLQW